MTTKCSALITLLALFFAPLIYAQQQQSSDTNSTAKDSADTIYRPGTKGVTPPRPTYTPDPEYSKKARADGLQGTVVLSLVVGKDGHPHNIKVEKSLGKGLDEKAVEAVSDWKFKPATKDGEPVSVAINVEVTFHLFR